MNVFENQPVTVSQSFSHKMMETFIHLQYLTKKHLLNTVFPSQIRYYLIDW